MALLQQKVEKLNAVISSPRSPFQFGIHLHLLQRSSSFSTSSSWESNEGDDGPSALHNQTKHTSLNQLNQTTSTPLNVDTRYSSPNSLVWSLDKIKQMQHKTRSAIASSKQLQKAINLSNLRIDSLDARMSILDKTVSALGSQSKEAKVAHHQINKALRASKITLKVFELLNRLQGILDEGPSTDIGHYIEALLLFQQDLHFLRRCCPAVMQGLWHGLEFLRVTQRVDQYEMHELNEAADALQSLISTQEYLTISHGVVDAAIEHMSSAFHRVLREYGHPIVDFCSCTIVKLEGEPAKLVTKYGEPVILQVPMPSPVIQILQKIAESMAYNKNLEICLEIYIKERGNILRQAVDMLQTDKYLCCNTSESINEVEWTVLEDYLAQWTQHMDVLVGILLPYEFNFFKQVFGILKTDYAWKDAFGHMAMEAGNLEMFLNFGEAFIKTQNEPQKLFKLLDMFECLQSLNPSFANMFGGKKCQKKLWVLNRGLVDGVANVFWNFKRHVQAQPNQAVAAGGRGGGVLKLVSYVVNYMNCLLSDFYKPLIIKVLNIHQSLKEGMAIQDSESEQLLAGAAQIMHALDKKVVANAEVLVGIPAFPSFFLMNNYIYIYSRCKGSEVGALLGEEWLQSERDKVELSAMQYKQEAWGSLLPYFSSRGLLSSSSMSNNSEGNDISRNGTRNVEYVRQRAKAFQTALQVVVERQKGWCIPDEELRQRICMDVVQSIVPAYEGFLDKYGHYLEYNMKKILRNSSGTSSSSSSNSKQPPNKIIAYSPERVESMLNGLFQT